MIELTEQQAQALEHPEVLPPRVLNPRTNETFVLLRMQVFQRLAHVEYDDSPWAREELEALAWDRLKHDDWDEYDGSSSEELEESSVPSSVIATAIKMLESLPEPAQEEVVEHLREYIAELQDERAWDARFKRTQSQLVAAARRAKEAIAQGQAEPLDLDRL